MTAAEPTVASAADPLSASMGGSDTDAENARGLVFATMAVGEIVVGTAVATAFVATAATNTIVRNVWIYVVRLTAARFRDIALQARTPFEIT